MATYFSGVVKEQQGVYIEVRPDPESGRDTVIRCWLPDRWVGDPSAEEELERIEHYVRLVDNDWKGMLQVESRYLAPIWDEDGNDVLWGGHDEAARALFADG